MNGTMEKCPNSEGKKTEYSRQKTGENQKTEKRESHAETQRRREKKPFDYKTKKPSVNSVRSSELRRAAVRLVLP